jgi:hypothetical protein
MSVSDAERYARRAKNAQTAEEVGENVKRAVDALVREIKSMQTSIRNLESRVLRLRH